MLTLTIAEINELSEMFPRKDEDITELEVLEAMAWYIHSLWEKNIFKNEEILYVKEAGDIVNYFWVYEDRLYVLSDESVYWGDNRINLRRIYSTSEKISKRFIMKFLRYIEWSNEHDYFEGQEDEFNFEMFGDAHEQYVEMSYGLVEILRNNGYKIIE
ncbi:hypothetical protein [Bacillus cereus]|uniref:hypothetical protein n=1 Tax=Bacillus cereus TaxID=1396 RepID=UPI001F1CEEC6|nr:hypothetical protein [Bacillus cereus]BCB35586.1 hypothetical protein BCM0045_0481 [Bacillus cereus]BCB98395.1 hypothetical protein BCM0057_0478 [Bacillus cereus]BCC21888.1 hypothetical protein BCM0079_0481 [Bacillus cereus]BCC33499.1 hypothetical protein BCM0105_0489 [Bacillus cereus]